jgi:hypothetical protein
MKRYIKSSEYIQASFSPSMPDWMKKKFSSRYSRDRDSLLNTLHLKLDTANFLDHPTENSVAIHLLEADNQLVVYAPGYNDNNGADFNGRWRDFGRLGKKTLKDRTLDTVYIDLDDPSNFDTDQEHYRDPRFEYYYDTNGQYAGQHKDSYFGWKDYKGREKRDKSGYLIPNPEDKIKDYYKKFPDKVTDKLDSIYEELVKLQQEIFAPERIKTKSKRYDSKFYGYSTSASSLSDAIVAYQELLDLVDRGFDANFDGFTDAIIQIRRAIKRTRDRL